MFRNFLVCCLCFFVSSSWALEKKPTKSKKIACLSPDEAGMPAAADTLIPETTFKVRLCYLPEDKMHNYVNEVHLLEKTQLIASMKYVTGATVGRPEISLDKVTSRFVGISIGLNEFCNGILILDLAKRKVAASQECVSQSHDCKIDFIDEKKCKAKLICKDNGGDAGEPHREADIFKELSICAK